MKMRAKETFALHKHYSTIFSRKIQTKLEHRRLRLCRKTKGSNNIYNIHFTHMNPHLNHFVSFTESFSSVLILDFFFFFIKSEMIS